MSLAVSTIASVLIGKALSLSAVVVFFLASAVLSLAAFGWEWLQRRRFGRKWSIGWSPLGGAALMLAVVWIVVTIVSLVDFESNRQLFMNLAIFDHAQRVNWTESVLRTGIPPANSFYLYKHTVPMRYYYFWYVVCGAVAQYSHLPARAVLVASCVWAGFGLAALIGLYLKHFLEVGVRLRMQFLRAIGLLAVTGLDICVNFVDILYFHRPLPGYLNVWNVGQITSWWVSLLWNPHHVVSLICCMIAFLLAWMAGKDGARRHSASVVLIALALASAFAGLLESGLFQHLEAGHPLAALNLAKLVLLVPGYAIELGFYFVVFLIYLVPAWRGRTHLTPARRSLVFIAASSFPLISLVRSGVLESNDFGWRAALLLQFPLLLLGSELIIGWKFAELKRHAPADCTGLPHNTPQWLRSIAALALIFGVGSTFYQALMMRFTYPVIEMAHRRAVHDPEAGNISHNVYILYLGYAQLDAVIPQDAVVQFNPVRPSVFWMIPNWGGIDHQVAMSGDQPGCGSEFGGDPSGCRAMAATIDPLFSGATAEQARTACRQYGIQYLVATMYDPVWMDKSGWVWTLRPVVSDEEFRALDCRQ